MSILINIKNFKSDHIRQLNRDLHVKQITQTSQSSNPKFQRPVYQSSNKVVECFDTFKMNVNEVACIPFSYYYHHFSESIESIPSKSEECDQLIFKGELLKRQKEVRDEILEVLNRTKSVVLSLHTGFGKTVMALYLACKIKQKTIILCHRKIIIDQWVSSIKKYIPDATYSILGEKIKKKSEFVDSKECDILICNVINVPKQEREFYNRFGCVIIDEIHTVCTDSFSKSLLYLFPKYVIGLSATPFRSDGMDRIIELYCGPEIIYRKLSKPFNVYKLNTGYKPDPKVNIAGQMDWNSVLEGQSTNLKRNKLIVNLCRYFITRNILVLVKRKEHALILQNLLKECGENVDVFMDTQTTFNEGCRILIATYSKGGVGFDFPKLDMFISGADVEEGFMQYIGRIFRRDDVSPIYIDLIDEMSTIKKHSTERLKICKEIGGDVKDFHKSFKDFNWYISKI